MPWNARSSRLTKPSTTPSSHYDEERNEYGSNTVQRISDPYMPTLMERTSSSLGFFQNILKTESSAALQLAWTVLWREMSEDLADIIVKIESLQRSCKFKDQQLLENESIIKSSRGNKVSTDLLGIGWQKGKIVGNWKDRIIYRSLQSQNYKVFLTTYRRTMKRKIGNTYDELHKQLEAEKMKVLAQEREANHKVTTELKKRVQQLEAELVDAMEIKNELIGKFNTLFRKKKSSKLKKEQLIQQVDDLSQEVELQKEVIAQLKKALNSSKFEMEDECEKSYEEGFKYGRYVATLEELGVLEQFKILKEIEATLEIDIRNEHHTNKGNAKIK